MSLSATLDVASWESLSFHDKVQKICDIANELSVEDFLSRLLILGTSLNCYPHARRYLMERLVATMMQCEPPRLYGLRCRFLQWIELLSDLTFLEERYVHDLSTSLDDLIYSSDSSDY